MGESVRTEQMKPWEEKPQAEGRGGWSEGDGSAGRAEEAVTDSRPATESGSERGAPPTGGPSLGGRELRQPDRWIPLTPGVCRARGAGGGAQVTVARAGQVPQETTLTGLGEDNRTRGLKGLPRALSLPER